MSSIPPQLKDLLKKIRECVDSDNYYITNHAIEEMAEDSVSIADILFILKTGWHEQEKTKFEAKHQAWNYAIRGRSLDGFDIRVIVGFKEKMAVITVIKLAK